MTKDEWDMNFRLLEYHHRAMESRRAISFSVFTGSVALYLLFAKGTVEYLKGHPPLPDPFFLLQVKLMFGAIFLLYVCFQIQMERVNKFDRQRYKALQEALFPAPNTHVPITRESWRETMSASWAATWTVSLLFLLAATLWFLSGYF